MVTIELRKVLVQAYHGVDPEELDLLNTFEIDLDVLYEEGGRDFKKLSDTINYASLYDIVKKKLAAPVHLLENICVQVISEIKQQYGFVQEIRISIYKLHAPIPNFQGKVGVTLRKSF